MAVVVALVSQKGGVGKSTLARGLGAILAKSGLKVRIADLDSRQHTVLHWASLRERQGVTPPFDVRAYRSIEPALSEATDVELLIIDAPGHASAATLTIARNAHLIVQPTGACIDDVYPAVLLFHELAQAGVDKSRLSFALCRTQESEEETARTYLDEAGYTVLPGSLPERSAYRDAHNKGRSIIETSRKDLNEHADALMLELMTRVAREVKTMRKGKRSSKKRGAA